jgi:hypothetical protein
MEIKKNAVREVHTWHRVVTVADGPIIDAGNSYVAGTKFQIDTVWWKYEDGQQADEIHVAGRRINKNGSPGKVTHDRVYFLSREQPEWLVELMDAAKKDLYEKEVLGAQI